MIYLDIRAERKVSSCSTVVIWVWGCNRFLSSCMMVLQGSFVWCALQVKAPHYCYSINQTFLWVTVWPLFESSAGCTAVLGTRLTNLEVNPFLSFHIVVGPPATRRVLAALHTQTCFYCWTTICSTCCCYWFSPTIPTDFLNLVDFWGRMNSCTPSSSPFSLPLQS